VSEFNRLGGSDVKSSSPSSHEEGLHPSSGLESPLGLGYESPTAHDLKRSYRETEDARPTERPKPAKAHGRSAVKAIRSDPALTAEVRSGPGYVFVGSRGQNRCHPETKKAIEEVGRQWNELHPGGPKIRIGAIGVVYGGPLVKRIEKSGEVLYHESHQKGIDVDVRPMRNDNRDLETEVDSPTYSHELTKQLIELFQNQGALKVDWVFFNDPAIPGVKHEFGHSNHFHVRFLPPPP